MRKTVLTVLTVVVPVVVYFVMPLDKGSASCSRSCSWWWPLHP